MSIGSLDIGMKMCDRMINLVEAGKSVEEIEEYCQVHKFLYNSMLRSGVGRSQSDWDEEDRQFQSDLEAPDDVPGIVKMTANPMWPDADEDDPFGDGEPTENSE